MAGSGKHDAGCVYGGFSCGYWMIAEGCPEEHHEVHYVLADGKCPCGHTFPGAQNETVGFDASKEDAA